MIACCNPKAQYESHKAAIDAAIARVLRSGRYILGGEVEAFEAEFARYIGVAHGVGVGSGTDAIHLALRACGIGVGDEVITVSHTAVATVAAIEMSGASPVLVDIEPGHFTMDPDRIKAAISRRTRAIVVVHLYGQPADLGAIMKIARARKLRVIEDCAQCHGAAYRGRKAGAWGDLSCFSFYPTKNLGALGDAGMVLTGDVALAWRVRWLREYGWKERNISSLRGVNSRLDEIQAAVLRVKLRRLDADNERRGRIARLYDDGLDRNRLILPMRRPGATNVFHLYVVRSARRDALRAFLAKRGVGTLVHYPMPVHRQPAYRGRVRCAGPMTATEQAAGEVLSLPMHPELKAAEAREVIRAVGAFGGGS